MTYYKARGEVGFSLVVSQYWSALLTISFNYTGTCQDLERHLDM